MIADNLSSNQTNENIREIILQIYDASTIETVLITGNTVQLGTHLL